MDVVVSEDSPISSSCGDSGCPSGCVSCFSSITGSLLEVAVDGFISCSAEGSLLMCAVWMVSATWRGMDDAMAAVGFS